ncbi:hypothetical protein Maynard_97 [Salmonella phage Maynard]|uniref:Uncharacterized protein n=2 Tax=Kuttervirus TaxID=2169536 RepID=U5PV75_9CAUD|nr:hypothetical protein Maynard_97 [Salmonella phage Maynard]YP_008771715.1 hypothetical protein Marshall_97 [Salmonella phage Marshall]AGY47614.1 hypothetical protein Marshall_97 [Salmonella phage Marshall]AGY47819.1 hypothetical protein Maynard_97 [Salmonella phage Maynard]
MEKLYSIIVGPDPDGLFTHGFCDDRMARGIYAALGVEKQTEQI